MMSFELTTPERVAAKVQAVSVSLPTAMGEITVLENHIPLLTVLAPGVVTLKKADGSEEYFAVGGGFVQVQPHVSGAQGTHVVVLADSADRSEELSVEAVEAARERAEQALHEIRQTDEATYALAAASLERELARLKVARKKYRPT